MRFYYIIHWYSTVSIHTKQSIVYIFSLVINRDRQNRIGKKDLSLYSSRSACGIQILNFKLHSSFNKCRKQLSSAPWLLCRYFFYWIKLRNISLLISFAEDWPCILFRWYMIFMSCFRKIFMKYGTIKNIYSHRYFVVSFFVNKIESSLSMI